MATPTDSGKAAPKHELAAIMFSDIADYTAIMGRDEESAMRALDAHRRTLRTLLPKFNGRLIGEIGDGTLSSFHSAIDAVNCARQVQALAEGDPELRLRIGIHLGDVMFSSNTVLGDGVNVASRIHALAPPAGICISSNVYDEIRNKPGMGARDLGERKLKNVSRPIRVYLLTPGESIAPKRFSVRGRAILIGGAALLLIVAVALVVVRWKWSPLTPGVENAAPARPIRSIAVLPLDNFSGDPNQEYFADGMTDELTTDLATISQLRVISRGSVMQFKGEHRPPTPQIAKLLNVDAVVEGSVLRVGDKVRITAQLIDAPADKHMWAKSYERDSHDVLALQDELAAAIAREVNVQLTPREQARLAGTRTVNPAAHEAYLKGRYLLNEPDEVRVRRALELFEQALKADPSFAPAYTGIADAYVWGEDWYFPATEVMPKAKAAAEKALQLDPGLAEAHSSLASIRFQYDFDWAGAEAEFRRAIEINPNYAGAHDQYGFALALQGKVDQSEAESRRATELDPLAAIKWADAGLAPASEGRFESSKEFVRKALDLDPNFFLPQALIGWIDIEAGKSSEAIPELEKALPMGAPPFVEAWLGYAYARSGQRKRAEAILAKLDTLSSQRFVSAYCMAVIHLGLDQKEQAFADLDKAYQIRSQWLGFLKVERMYDPIRSDPRFIALLKKVGLAPERGAQ